MSISVSFSSSSLSNSPVNNLSNSLIKMKPCNEEILEKYKKLPEEINKELLLHIPIPPLVNIVLEYIGNKEENILASYWETRVQEGHKHRIILDSQKLKGRTLYGLFIENRFVLIEWVTSLAKPPATAKKYFLLKAPEEVAPVINIIEKDKKNFHDGKVGIRMMRYETEFGPMKKKSLKTPHLTLDNRRKYLIEGNFEPDTRVQLWQMNGPEGHQKSIFHYDKKWSEIPSDHENPSKGAGDQSSSVSADPYEGMPALESVYETVQPASSSISPTTSARTPENLHHAKKGSDDVKKDDI